MSKNRFRTIVLSLAAIPAFLAAQNANQALAPSTGAITGVVIDGATGAVVPDAVVYISMPGRPAPIPQSRQLTDAKGRFGFVNLPVSTGFTISAGKLGYLDGGYGRDTSPTDPLRPIPLREGGWMPNIRVTLWRPGAIAGAVRDERNEPVVGVFVRVLARVRVGGRTELATGPLTTTDDRGMYRISGLLPGRYLVHVPSVQSSAPASLPWPSSGRATTSDTAMEVDDIPMRLAIGRYPLPPPPANGKRLAYPMILYPSATTLAEATPIELTFGDERTDVDITLTPVSTARISGVVDAPPEGLNNLTLRLLPAGLENLGAGGEAATAFVDQNGRFTFLNVPAGSYVIEAPRTISEYTLSSASGRGPMLPVPPARTQGWGRTGLSIDSVPGLGFSITDFRSGMPYFYGRVPVTVQDVDVTDVVVRLRAAATMSGVIRVEADPGQPVAGTPPRFFASADPADGSASLGMPRAQGSADAGQNEFTLNGLQPGEYFLRIGGPAGWVVKSIQWKGREYLDAPFDAAAAADFSGVVVTITNAVPVLSGTVRQADGSAARNATVLIFPADHGSWAKSGIQPVRYRAIAITNTGSFKMDAAPAGEYLAVALSAPPVSGWRDPAFLALAERAATRVTLNWGGQTTQDLTLRQVQ